jgi:hypothetical protein
MLKAAELMARQENRTMSELVREALRVYQRERKAWQDIFDYGEANARELGLKKEDDVVRIVREARRQRRTTGTSAPKHGTR